MRLLNDYVRERFGCKLYKLSLSADVTCPNRDGTLDSRGCIFCSAGGSGDFASDRYKSIHEQILEAKKRVAKKNPGGRYIAYFQSYTGTYAPVSYLRRIFTEALAEEDVAVLSVATRPDCLGEETVSLLSEATPVHGMVSRRIHSAARKSVRPSSVARLATGSPARRASSLRPS